MGIVNLISKFGLQFPFFVLHSRLSARRANLIKYTQENCLHETSFCRSYID